MAKRSVRLEKGIESIKEEIKSHFDKLDKEIKDEDEIMARYHIKEIDKSLIDALEYKINLLGKNKEDEKLIIEFRRKLKDYKDKLGIEEE